MTFRIGALPLVIGAAVLYGCTTPPPTHSYDQPFYIQAQTQADLAAAQEEPATYPSMVPGESEAVPAESGWRPVNETGLDQQPSAAAQLYASALKAPSDASRLSLLQKAADAGSPSAHYDIAKIYSEGKVLPRNLALAQEHLQASASLGDAEATRVLGWQMVRGDNGPQNLNGGVALMEVGAQTSVRAQRELGMLYADLYDGYRFGETAKGEMYLVQAYRAGDVPAAVALGRLYIREGRQIDAVAPLSFGSANGDATAKKLVRGLGLEVDSSSTQANVTQVDDAVSGEQFYLEANAIMLRKHSANDEGRAYALFSLASERGYNLAKVEMAAIEGVRIQMDALRGTAWLEQEKQAILAGGR